MTETKTKKFENIEDPGIRAFLIEGERFHPQSAVAYSIAEQRAFYDTIIEAAASLAYSGQLPSRTT